MVSKDVQKSANKKRKETLRLKKLCTIEEEIRQRGYHVIAGIDEAGRGPLAGPVVAAACILPEGMLLRGVNDSKKLLFDQRYKLYQELVQHPNICYGVGVIEAVEIDQLNILQATLKAMLMAVQRLTKIPDYLLIDGKQLPVTEIAKQGIIDGDRLCQSIAAASIIAKVTRDHIMMGYHDLYPEYGFGEHKGYGTAEHLQAIGTFGPCPIHRKSFGLLKRNEEELLNLELVEGIDA